MLGLGLGFTIVIHAQSNALWIQDGYGEIGTGGNPVGIVLANEDVLGGFQFDLSYDHSLIQVEEVIVAGHIAGMDLYTSEPEPGILTVVVVSLNGELIIPKVSMILEIQYFVQGNNQNEPVLLGLTNVAFSDTEGITVPDVSADGFFFVEGVNSLRLENGFDSIPINLYNDFTVGGVQFTLSYDSNVVSLDQVQTTLRSEEMDLSFNEISSGMVTILLYSFDQKTITPGSGPMLNLLFENISEEYSTIALDLSNVAVSNEQGTTVEIDFFNGTYFILDPSIILQPPLISDINDMFMEEDDSLRIALHAYDQNVADLLSFSAMSESNEVDLQIVNNDTLFILPEQNWNGSLIITVIVTDGIFSDSTSFTLSVIAVNDAPVLAAIADTSTAEDTPLVLTLAAAEVDDGEELTFSAVSEYPDNVAANVTGDQLTLTPAEDWYGSVNISVTVSDGELLDDMTFVLTVTPVDDFVYPGDTNKDGFVNASDVLPLGIYFYLTGPKRSPVGFDWLQLSPATSWNPVAATYADANGDGIINERDLFGIGLNWGMTHTNGSKRFVIDPNDSTLLTLHKPAFEKLYQALGGVGEPTQQIKLLLERILGIEYIPDKFYLYQNYPNPFNPSTTIKFDLQDEEYVMLNIFDIGGKLVETLFQNKLYQGGTHAVTLHADNLSNGLYFYQITAGKWQSTQKMIILK